MNKYSPYLFVFLGIFLLGFVLQVINANNDFSKVDTRALQDKLHKKSSHTVKLMNRLADSIKARDLSKEQFFEEFSSYLESNDQVISVYKDEQLLFWSDNTLPFEKFEKQSSEKVIELGNAWYWKKHVSQGKYDVYGFILVKKIYPYENRFVKTHFQENFDLPVNLKVVKNERRGITVNDENGNYLFSLLETNTSENELVPGKLPGTLYLLGFLFLGIFLLKWLMHSFVTKSFWFRLIISVLVLFALRYVMILFDVPEALYNLKFFDPTYYASSSLIPSLGDLFLHLVFAGVIIYPLNLYFRDNSFSKKFNKRYRLVYSFLFLLVNVFLFLLIHSIFKSIIYNSSFSLTLYNFLDFTLYSFLGFLVIFLLLLIYFLVVDLSHIKLHEMLTFRQLIIVSVVVFCIASLYIYYSDYTIHGFSVVFFFLSNLLVYFVVRDSISYNYTQHVLLVLISTLFVTYFIDYHTGVKEIEKRKVLVTNLENERDRVGEYLLKQTEESIAKDEKIAGFINSRNASEKLESYLTKQYFEGYFRKYDVKASLCYSEDDIIQIYDVSMSNYETCERFRKYIKEDAVALRDSRFYFLDNQDNRISYIGNFQITGEEESKRNLFILLESKPSETLLVYPELLLDEEITQEGPLSEYAYAKYRNDQLVRHSGEFDYPLKLIDIFKSEKEYAFHNYRDYHHLIYKADPEVSILISKPRKQLLDVLAQLSYIFAIFYLLVLLFVFAKNFPWNIRIFNYNFKNKIKLSMILLLIISLLAVGTATVYYTIDQFRIKQKETISEKLQSIIVELEHEISSETPLDKGYSDYLTALLRNYSNTFYVDINLYSLEGNLLASSRPQVFERNLVGKKMNPKAYQKLAYYDMPKYIHNEKIGSLEYQSAYVPLYNNNNKCIAYLNLPYFTKQKALKKEIYTIAMVFVNIYVFLIILGTVTAVIVSNNVTKPLRMIRERLRQIGLNKRNEKINYESHDEVGELISEYNRMVDELDDKAQQLAQTERESAWREMAKQIAHEIKNPLTPMKLKVQYLKRAWDDGVSNFNERLEKFTNSMISQIDTLSGIATEFSNFAKMPKAKKQPLVVENEVKEVVSLFENTHGVRLDFNSDNADMCKVYVDKDQLSRVFSNLIKNAIQAIPSGRKGYVNLSVSCDNEYVYISVEDNGVGISKDIQNKLFNPNFTTKSTGVGMGLAISKRIIEDFDGELWYETQLNKGTTFHIRLPMLYDE
jgi:signal transduction histidine kinase